MIRVRYLRRLYRRAGGRVMGRSFFRTTVAAAAKDEFLFDEQ